MTEREHTHDEHEEALRAPGSVLPRTLGFGPPKLNRRLCRACFRSVGKGLGGADVARA